MEMIRRSACVLIVLLIVVVVAGCQQKRMRTSVEADLPARVEDYPGAKARLQRLDPSAKVGRVIAVLPDERMAAIGDINVQDFQRGDSLQILGAGDTPVASAVVVSIVNDTLHVRYTPVGEGARRPYEGDLAIRFTMPVR